MGTACHHFLGILIRVVGVVQLGAPILAGLLIGCQIIDIEFARLDALHDLTLNLLNIGLPIALYLYLMGGDDLHLVLEHLLLNDGSFLVGFTPADLQSFNRVISLVATGIAVVLILVDTVAAVLVTYLLRALFLALN